MKPTVYIETSVVSYLTARPSRDLVTATHQQITRHWWKNVLSSEVEIFWYNDALTLTPGPSPRGRGEEGGTSGFHPSPSGRGAGGEGDD